VSVNDHTSLAAICNSDIYPQICHPVCTPRLVIISHQSRLYRSAAVTFVVVPLNWCEVFLHFVCLGVYLCHLAHSIEMKECQLLLWNCQKENMILLYYKRY